MLYDGPNLYLLTMFQSRTFAPWLQRSTQNEKCKCYRCLATQYSWPGLSSQYLSHVLFYRFERINTYRRFRSIVLNVSILIVLFVLSFRTYQ